MIEHDVTRHGDVSVVALRGRLDAVRVGGVRQELVNLPEQGRVKVVVDLSGLEWIDSSGVGALVTLYKRARSKGGDVKVVGLSGQPKEIFRLLRLESAFQVLATVDEAVSSLG